MGAAGIPNLYHVLGDGSGEYLPRPDYHAMAMSDAVGTSTEAPAVYQTAEDFVPRVYGSFSTGYVAFRAPDHALTQLIEFVGASHEEDGPRILGLELNSGTYEINPGRQEHQQHPGETSRMDMDEQCEVVFAKGEPDVVTITRSDLEGLLPMGFLSDNIIDFYIEFLKRELSSEDRERFYFFNSFFFRKLLPDSRSSAAIHQCGVDFDGVRSWTGEVNLFEKDYVFIPIIRRSHWSLIIVCHLNGLANSRDKRRGSPCVYHLDPLRGLHESFEDLIRSYIIQACMKCFPDSNDRDRIILALACEMKYIRAEVPQQGNEHDCGVYLLHYVEVFLRESNSPHFNFPSTSNIWGRDFAEGASSKRCCIQSLILELSENPQAQLRRPTDIQPRPHPRASDAPNSYAGRNRSPKPRILTRSKLSKKWKEDETSLLLKRMVEGGRIRKGTKGATHWELISQEIKTELGFTRTADECRRRYDTLLKAYKKVEKTGKSFCDTTKKELVELNLATPLTDEWCRAIDTICQLKSGTAKPRKRAKRSPDGEDDMPSGNPAPPPIPSGCPARGTPSRKQVAIPGFSSLREDLRLTLLNLIQVFVNSAPSEYDSWWTSNLEEVYRMLAIVEDQKLWKIRKKVYELSELKLVDLRQGKGSNRKAEYLDKDSLRVFKKFVEKVLCKNPDFNFYLTLWKNDDIVSIPGEPASLSLQQIRVLIVHGCSEVEKVDLRRFPELRILSIENCGKLTLVTGWEVVTKLAWLEIDKCESYVDFPSVQYLSSLREFQLGLYHAKKTHRTNSVPDDFRQCVGLRRLQIWRNESWALNKMDLSTLKFLKVLEFYKCDALTSIQGLSGLNSLVSLDLCCCKALKRVPELGYLKALTHLDMRESGVEEISGVHELYSLRSLDLHNCYSLKKLPFLGHLKALALLDICQTGVEVIPGMEDLVNLKTLNCNKSKLKWLPYLHHLPHLQKVRIEGTPLSAMESSLLYFGKEEVYFGSSNVEGKVLHTEISDISDTE